jgi:hypothetical protein
MPYLVRRTKYGMSQGFVMAVLNLSVSCSGGATGEASVFTLSSNNAVVQMLGRGGPRVVTAQLDSKRELEQQLKAVCESYIMALTKMAVEPMLGFLTKVTAVRVAAKANPQLARPLKDQVGAVFLKFFYGVGMV